MKSPKFLLMTATIGLAFALSTQAHAQTQEYSNQDNIPQISLKDTFNSVKNFFQPVVDSGKNAVNSISNSQVAQNIKEGALNTYHSDSVQNVKNATVNTANNIYQNETVQNVKNATVKTSSDVYNSSIVQNTSANVNKVVENSVGQDNLNNVKGFFGNLMNKAKAVVVIEDPIETIANSDRVKNTEVSLHTNSSQDILKNVQELREKSHPSRTKSLDSLLK